LSEVKVKIKDLSVIYDNGDGVRNIDLDIYESEILTLLGPSGCGKSTILRAIGGFNKLTGGEIIIDGEDISQLPPEKRPTSMVFQSYNLWPHMTVYENLAFGLKLRKISSKEIESEINKVLKLLKMEGFEDKYPAQLSGGQQQRIAIGRSVLLKPAVLLLDEPFSALDAKIRHQMREELKRIQSELNISVVFVTHDQEEAISISHRIVVMDKGKIAQVGTPTEIYEEPVNPYVASFIGEMNFIDEGDKFLAFRPEEVEIVTNDSGEYPATIEHIMLYGHYSQVLLRGRHNMIRAFVPKTNMVDIEEHMKVSFNVTKIREYEKEI
jgi:putative spermidine/putrescine transport system ATP-binding protein